MYTKSVYTLQQYLLLLEMGPPGMIIVGSLIIPALIYSSPICKQISSKKGYTITQTRL